MLRWLSSPTFASDTYWLSRSTFSGNVGIPITLLYEAEGMKVTVEVSVSEYLCESHVFLHSLILLFLQLKMKNGEIYRGLLLSAEDTMNLSLSEVLRTARNGQITKLPCVYLRGSSIRFIALPDLLKNAPVFQKVANMKRKMEKEQQDRQQLNGK
jgi:small nuclear ribonucleoprotein D3